MKNSHKKDQDTISIVKHILQSINRDFASEEVFIRYIQASPELSFVSRVNVEECLKDMIEKNFIEIVEQGKQFRLSSKLLSIFESCSPKTGMCSIKETLSKETFEEVRNVFRQIEEGDKIYYSTYAGTTVLDVFSKEFENCLLKDKVKLHIMVLGEFADNLLKETNSDKEAFNKFNTMLKNAEQEWFKLENIVGKGKIEIRQCQGFAGINRCIIVTDHSNNIKYCGILVWEIGKRGVDGVYISSFLSKLNLGYLYLEDFINKWQNATTYNGKIFICHSSKDKAFCRKLSQKLTADRIPVWFDEQDILAGEDFIERMEDGIRHCDFVTIVLSPNFLKGLWAQREYKVALEKEVSLNRVQVIPVYKSTIQDGEFPSFLKTKNYADFRNSFDRGYEKLIRSVQELPLRRFASNTRY